MAVCGLGAPQAARKGTTTTASPRAPPVTSDPPQYAAEASANRATFIYLSSHYNKHFLLLLGNRKCAPKNVFPLRAKATPTLHDAASNQYGGTTAGWQVVCT